MLFCFTVVVACHALQAQVERILPRRSTSSLEGTAFVVGFMQNEIGNISVEPRLQIFISSQYDAVVTITYPTAPFQQIRYIAANTVHVETVPSNYACETSEVVERKAIGIVSTAPIVVYALNSLATSTDSYSVIPIKHLGMQYFTVNMPTDYYQPRWPNAELDTARRVGEFMIMGVKNNTDVTITPATTTRNNQPAWRPFSVTLDSGEVYQVQARAGSYGMNDLTGSRIEADRPVAVLSGHMRSSVPTRQRDSKDHLVEMLPPLEKWGTEYVTTPFAQVEGGDIIRIMAADADTRVEMIADGATFEHTFSRAGEWRDLTVSAPVLYRGNKPFFVTQFMPSSRVASGTSPFYDPAMVVVPSTDRFVQHALFQFPTLDTNVQVGTPREFYYYVNLVAEAAALPTLRVNVKRVLDLAPEIQTQVVPGTDLHWAQVRFVPGVYLLTADTGRFSGVMYGTAYADSYANLFGVSYEPIVERERTPPSYQLQVSCGSVKGVIADVGVDSVQLRSVQVQTALTYNYTWIISNPIDNKGSIEFSAQVRDLSKPAQLVIHTYDVLGNGKEWLYQYVPSQFRAPTAVDVSVMQQQRTCVPVSIVNTGDSTITIASVRLNGDPQFVFDEPPTQTTIAPGDSLTVVVCYEPSTASGSRRCVVEVMIDCGRRIQVPVRVATSASLVAQDLDLGRVRIGDTVCGSVPIVNNGLDPVDVDAVTIGMLMGTASTAPWFEIQSTRPSLPARLQRGDTLWLEICATPDSEDSVTRTDTIMSTPDLGVMTTVRVRGVQPRVASHIIDWGRQRVGTRQARDVVMANTGSGSCVLSFVSSAIAQGVFDDAASEFPLQLGPSQSRTLMLAFTPPAVGIYRDTITLEVDWRPHEPVTIILLGEGVEPVLQTQDIDMGDVVVGMVKDSVVQYLSATGTMPSTIRAVRVMGPDDTSFVTDARLAQLTDVQSGQQVLGSLRFLPERVGEHRMVIELDHDGGRAGSTETALVRIRGRGLAIPVPDFVASLIGAPRAIACTPLPVQLVVRNTGETDVRIDSVVMQYRSGTSTSSNIPHMWYGPFPVLAPMEQTSWQVDLLPIADGSNVVVVADVYANDTLYRTDTYRCSVDAATPSMRVSPRSSLVYGEPMQLHIQIQQPQRLAAPARYRLRLTAPADRWTFVRDVPLLATVEGASTATVPVTVGQIADGCYLEVEVPGGDSHTLTMDVTGIPYWKDQSPVLVAVELLPDQCYPGADTSIGLAGSVCGGNVRAVNLGALPVVTAVVLDHPASEVIAVELQTTVDTEIRVHLWDVTGQRYQLADKFSLQKGTTQCNFSAYGVASGIYQLVIGYGNGETTLPIVLVK